MIARRFPALAVAALAMAATALALVSTTAHADDYPSRPIKLIVPFPPGGGNDNVARPIAQKLSDALGQQVIIDNRPGAGTMIGAEAAAHSLPNGYTLFLGSIASHAISPNLYARVPYDPIKDFEPVSLLASAPTLLVVNTHTPYKTLKDVLVAAKANPGKLTYGSAGSGTPPHLSGEIFRGQASIDLLHVPYKGGSGLLPDVMAGRVDMIFDTAASSMPHVRSGSLRAIAIARATRQPDLPDVPTFAEQGFPKFQTSGWYGILAPAKTPKPVIDKLYAALQKAMVQPEVTSRLKTLGVDPIVSTPQEFGTFIRAELEKYKQVIRQADIKE
ncbi:tripartite tricarboxylate transporter substrate binding protein [Cupriavidus sp. CV2]|uniref:Bug family tripartite tricarboxylate transporter substrate binding protein n=1 Tax=Cupriavidus ulmosensis TaxID=3065913 RepID=UPI00296B14DE|nr:tripartite tricarboxylate transporter substrate binding protein [Cupriavidus sp. CV2]MDW3686912.1 tripartite tricarboxylate transporter substrate binding protein [Cupriavidus sp. CV2]